MLRNRVVLVFFFVLLGVVGSNVTGAVCSFFLLRHVHRRHVVAANLWR